MNSRRARCSRPFTLPSGVVGDLGDLLVAEALCVAQHEHGAVLRGEAAQLALEALDPLAHLEALGRRALRRSPRTRPRSRGRRARRAPAREVIERRVVRDAQQPRRGTARRRGSAPRRWKARRNASWLTSSASSAPDDPRGDAHDDVAMALDELLERAQIPLGREPHELRVVAPGGSVAWFGLTTGLTAEAASGLHRFARRDLCLTPGRVPGLERGAGFGNARTDWTGPSDQSNSQLLRRDSCSIIWPPSRSADSLQRGLDEFVGFLPRLIGFLIILLIGWLIARAVKAVLVKALQGVGIDRALAGGSAGPYVDRVLPDARVSEIIGTIAFWFIFLGALAIAVSQLGIGALDNFLQAIAAYLPNVVVAILIFVVAGVLADGGERPVSRTLGDSATGQDRRRWERRS